MRDRHLSDVGNITIYYKGRPISAAAGQTVAGALYAAGVRIFSRSFKYHRPRGLLCCQGACPNCMMNVDGRPNVRTCTTPVADGMRVRPQNAWPSPEFDVLSIFDKADRFMPVGFYYKTMIRPKLSWKLAEPIIRRIAGLGEVPGPPAPGEARAHDDGLASFEKVHVHADVAVVGGGPAGVAGAVEAARLGLRVALIDNQPRLGGHLLAQVAACHDPGEFAGKRGLDIAEALARWSAEQSNVEVLSDATAFGVYEGGLLGVVRGRELIRLRHRRLLIAAGAIEKPVVFLNNDLPGVMLGSGIQRLMHRDGVKPGNTAVVLGADRRAAQVACDLVDGGVGVAALVFQGDLPADAGEQLDRLGREGVRVLESHTIVRAVGRKHVKAAVVAAVDDEAVPDHDGEISFKCDLIVQAAGYRPLAELLSQAGAKLTRDDRADALLPTELPADTFAAGHVSGWTDLEAILLSGKLAAARAALSLGIVDPEADRRVEAWRARLDELSATRPHIRPLGVVRGGGKKKFVCYCEDVTEKDLTDAMDEGYDGSETLKRYSTVTMGPCQGKMCARRAAEIAGRHTGRGLPVVGPTTMRPPVQPLTLGALAGRNHHPTRLSPMHEEHLAAGAKMMVAGQWYRPEHYGDPDAEYNAVRESVGVIDVSTLGKLEVRGPDAVALLERIYTNRYANLEMMKVRYGVLCDEAGIILDDGTVCRLGPDRFFVTATTSGVDRVEDWLTWWATAWGMKVWVTNVSSCYAALNVAGPRSRDVLARLADFDVSGKAIPYMGAALGRVAGVEAMVFRIGFTGELGYELHFRAEYGASVWRRVLDVGEGPGPRPFGVEAQRRLRLDKRHLLVGVDTDATSNPFEAGLGWIVKLDKPDFIGKALLTDAKARGPRNKLVGFVVEEGNPAPRDGQAILADGAPVGRVTSARFSGVMDRAIGLGWVPVEMAVDGRKLLIGAGDEPIEAKVYEQPFYDADGDRLRM